MYIPCCCTPISENLLEKVKKLRELTGVGFNDCKKALEENKAL